MLPNYRVRDRTSTLRRPQTLRIRLPADPNVPLCCRNVKKERSVGALKLFYDDAVLIFSETRERTGIGAVLSMTLAAGATSLVRHKTVLFRRPSSSFRLRPALANALDVSNLPEGLIRRDQTGQVLARLISIS